MAGGAQTRLEQGDRPTGKTFTGSELGCDGGRKCNGQHHDSGFRHLRRFLRGGMRDEGMRHTVIAELGGFSKLH